MYLKSLELSGFKSFSKKTTLEFSAPIVAIVGPNGSGKSNVAEAFRFVLGEQSIKSMRGKRGEDLIFNGSKNILKLNRAGVILTFNNHKRIFNIDFEEVSLERVVYRDSTNEYLINGSKTRLRDIFELLATANMGSSSHNIISQGESDRMLNASIKERKMMIEDALGLKIYQYKKQESERKLEKTSENITQVIALRKEIAPHIRFLEKQVEKLNRVENLKAEIITLYREYLSREEKHLLEAKEEIKTSLKAPLQEEKAIIEKLEKVKLVLAKVENDEKSQELLTVERELPEVESRVEAERRELSRLEGIIFAEEKTLKRAENSVLVSNKNSVALSEIEALVRDSNEALKEVEKEENLFQLRKLVKEVISRLQNFIEKKKLSSGESNEIYSLQSEINELKAKAKKIEQSEEILKAEAIKLTERYQRVKVAIEDERNRGREAEREMFALMNRRNELTIKISELRREENILARETEAFKAELVEAEALCGIAAIQYEKIKENKDDSRQLQEDRRRRLEKLKIRLEEIGSSGGEEVKREYDEVKERDEFLEREIADLEKSTETLKNLITELGEKLEFQFSEGLKRINTEFQNFFILMFGGGVASLSLIKREIHRRKETEFLEEEEEDEETEEGIDISVSLPNKRTKGLVMLSGGERALTSIALLFAISQVNPPPFIILDETDAALDEANSRKYGDMIENLSKHSQLILITHNRETMSRAGILYGVTMGADGTSKLLSVKFDEAIAVAK